MDILTFLIALANFPFVFTNVFGFRIIGLTGSISSGKSTTTRILRNIGIPVIDFDLIAREVVQPGGSCLKQIAKEFGPSILLSNGSLNRPELGRKIFADPRLRNKLNSIMRRPLLMRFVVLLVQFFFLGTIPSSYTGSYIQSSKSFRITPRQQSDNSDSTTTTPDEHVSIPCEDIMLPSHGVATNDLYPGLLQRFGGSRIVVIDAPLLFEYGLDKLCTHVLYIDCDPSVQLSRLMKRDKCTEEEARKKIAAQWDPQKKKSLSSVTIENNRGVTELYNEIVTWWTTLTRQRFGLHLVQPKPFRQGLQHFFEQQDHAYQTALEYAAADRAFLEESQNNNTKSTTDSTQTTTTTTRTKTKQDKKTKSSKTSPTIALISRSTIFPPIHLMIDMDTKPSWWESHSPMTFCLKPTLASILFTLLFAIPSFFIVYFVEHWFGLSGR